MPQNRLHSLNNNVCLSVCVRLCLSVCDCESIGNNLLNIENFMRDKSLWSSPSLLLLLPFYFLYFSKLRLLNATCCVDIVLRTITSM